MQPLLNDSVRASILTLVCAKCSRWQQFGVGLGDAGVAETRERVAKAGWIRRGEQTICPQCPQTRDEKRGRLSLAEAEATSRRG